MECESKICTLWSPKGSRKSARFCVTVLSNNSPSVSAVSKIWKNNAQILYKAHFWCRRLDIKHPTKNLMYHSFLLKKEESYIICQFHSKEILNFSSKDLALQTGLNVCKESSGGSVFATNSFLVCCKWS